MNFLESTRVIKIIPNYILGNMIFASGSAFVTLTTAVSLSVTFLLLDRIFILTFPMQYKQNRAAFIFVTIVACATIVVLILGALIMTELPVDRKTSKLFWYIDPAPDV